MLVILGLVAKDRRNATRQREPVVRNELCRKKWFGPGVKVPPSFS
jgi:hypothetical protein